MPCFTNFSINTQVSDKNRTVHMNTTIKEYFMNNYKKIDLQH